MTGQPRKEPDVSTPYFNVWEYFGTDIPQEIEDHTPLLTINHDEKEELYESRTYQDCAGLGYTMLLLTKRRGNKDEEDLYYFAIKLKRPTGQGCLQTGTQGPLTLEHYKENIDHLEQVFSFLFDIEHVQIVPGKHLNIYLDPSRRRHPHGAG
jgi:hypothetical protein